MKKRILLAISMIAVMTVLFAVSVSAAKPVKTWDVSATENDNVTAYLYNDPSYSSMYTLTISGNGAMKNWTYSSYVPWYSYRRSITTVTIENGIKNIGSDALYYCDSLTSVVIGDSVTSIGNYAFYYCDSLTSVVIPDSVTSIGDSAFRYCYSLTSVVIGDSVTSIGFYAFEYCDSLTSVVIPDSVTSIGSSAFRYCSSLTSITVKDGNTSYKSLDGNLYTYDMKTLIQYAIGKKDTLFVIPNGVTSIGNFAFRSCTSLTSVVIGDSVTSIGNSAFYYCDSLTSVVIPDSVTSIGSFAFYNCNSLTIYLEATTKPDGWDPRWRYKNNKVVGDYKNTLKNRIFEYKGYSFSEAGGFAIGFDINYEAKALYEKLTGEVLDIGVVFAGYDNLAGKTPLDQNGNVAKLSEGRVIKKSLTEYGYTSYDFIISDISDDIKDVKLVIASYVYDGNCAKYEEGNSLSDTVKGISYNDAKTNTSIGEIPEIDWDVLFPSYSDTELGDDEF